MVPLEMMDRCGVVNGVKGSYGFITTLAVCTAEAAAGIFFHRLQVIPEGSEMPGRGTTVTFGGVQYRAAYGRSSADWVQVR